MQYGKYSLVDGKWVAKNTHSAPEPVSRGITPGQPCAGYVRTPRPEAIADRKRRFDKVSDSQVSSHLRQLDQDEEAKKHQFATDLVNGAARDLESGKVRVAPDVFREGTPFGSITDERGVRHIVPKDRLPPRETTEIALREERDRLLQEKAQREAEDRTQAFLNSPANFKELVAESRRKAGL